MAAACEAAVKRASAPSLHTAAAYCPWSLSAGAVIHRDWHKRTALSCQHAFQTYRTSSACCLLYEGEAGCSKSSVSRQSKAAPWSVISGEDEIT